MDARTYKNNSVCDCISGIDNSNLKFFEIRAYNEIIVCIRKSFCFFEQRFIRNFLLTDLLKYFLDCIFYKLITVTGIRWQSCVRKGDMVVNPVHFFPVVTNKRKESNKTFAYLSRLLSQSEIEPSSNLSEIFQTLLQIYNLRHFLKHLQSQSQQKSCLLSHRQSVTNGIYLIFKILSGTLPPREQPTCTTSSTRSSLQQTLNCSMDGNLNCIFRS